MNAAKLATSEKMRALLAFLQGRGAAGATSAELAERFHFVAVATEISALRHNGIAVSCEFERVTETGRRQYRYRVA